MSTPKILKIPLCDIRQVFKVLARFLKASCLKSVKRGKQHALSCLHSFQISLQKYIKM